MLRYDASEPYEGVIDAVGLPVVRQRGPGGVDGVSRGGGGGGEEGGGRFALLVSTQQLPCVPLVGGRLC